MERIQAFPGWTAQRVGKGDMGVKEQKGKTESQGSGREALRIRQTSLSL